MDATVRCLVRRDTYRDSVELMRVAAEVERLPGVSNAALLMGTPANRELLAGAGLLVGESWIGYDDLTEDGRFEWSTGAQPGYSNWNEGEPNNDGGEDCCGMLGPGSFAPQGTWNDFDCATQLTYVCECDPLFQPRPVPSCMSDAAYDVIRDGRRYRWTGTSASWQGARDVCFADDADLVSLHDDPRWTALLARHRRDMTAEMSRRHNNANILCLPADLVGDELMRRVVDVWLRTDYEGGRHDRRLEKITHYESNGRLT